MCRYLLGQIPCLPWCEEELNKETVTIRDPLIKINRLGFLTINSQPRVCGAPSTDPTFGWGTPGGYVCVILLSVVVVVVVGGGGVGGVGGGGVGGVVVVVRAQQTFARIRHGSAVPEKKKYRAKK